MEIIDKAIAWYEHLSQKYFNDAVISVHRDHIKEGEALSRKAREYRQVVEWLRELKQLREARPHGKWERHYSRPGVYADLFWHCSNCGYKSSNDNANIYYQYCPNCGSDNREVTDE